jgi:von Willebrand factor type A domain
MSQIGFKVDSFLNNYMPIGGRRVDVVFSLRAEGLDCSSNITRKVMGFAIDCSGSMENDERMDSAKRATYLAIQTLDENELFFVIGFAEFSVVVVELCRATTQNKEKAKEAIKYIEAGGGRYRTGTATVMSRALLASRDQFAGASDAICQLLMISDGGNDKGDRNALERALRDCSGKFQTHCRSVGTDFAKLRPVELSMIANKLLGSLDSVGDPSKLVDDFQKTIANASRKSMADVRLRLKMPQNSSLKSIKQGYPVDIDISDKVVQVDKGIFEIALGAFGDDVQEYAATFEVVPFDNGQQMLVCRPTVLYTDPDTKKRNESVSAPVTVRWTGDPSLTAKINAQVAHYNGQSEKAELIQQGLEAIQNSDDGKATKVLTRVLDICKKTSDEETTRRVRQLVDVDHTGTMTIRRGAAKDKVALMSVATGATLTVRARVTGGDA